MYSNVSNNKEFKIKRSELSTFTFAGANVFQSMMCINQLDETDSLRIEKILVDNFQPGMLDQYQVSDDALELKRLTSEIKTIGKQGIILSGERVKRAQTLLKNYKNGTFVKWIDFTFSNRKTAYNMLSYFDLYNELPNQETKEQFKKIPMKSAYIIASRTANLNIKKEVINQFHDRSISELNIIIDEKMPLAEGDKRSLKTDNVRLMQILSDAVKKFRQRKNSLTNKEKNQILGLIQVLESIFDKKVVNE